jgi:uncharacterized phage protein (TIGR02220 family)
MLTSLINHRIRRDLGLGCFQYLVLDVLYQTKESTVAFISSALSVGDQVVEEKLRSMNEMEPALVKQIGTAWLITEECNKVLTGEMFLKEKPKKLRIRNDMAEKVINFFNELNGTRYSPETYAGEINKILKNKDMTFEHFEMVIKHKYLTWSADEKMKEYNRPKTLFSTKFMSYLDDARIYWDKKLKEQIDYSDINR